MGMNYKLDFISSFFWRLQINDILIGDEVNTNFRLIPKGNKRQWIWNNLLHRICCVKIRNF